MKDWKDAATIGMLIFFVAIIFYWARCSCDEYQAKIDVLERRLVQIELHLSQNMYKNADLDGNLPNLDGNQWDYMGN